MESGICGITFVGSTGIEWVCIAKPHDEGYRRKTRSGEAFGTGSHPERGIYGAPKSERHHMVNKWPNRPIVK